MRTTTSERDLKPPDNVVRMTDFVRWRARRAARAKGRITRWLARFRTWALEPQARSAAREGSGPNLVSAFLGPYG